MSQLGLSMTTEPPTQQGPSGKGSKIAVVVALLVVVGLIVGVLGFAYLKIFAAPADYEGSGTGQVTVKIKEGQSITSIGETLTQENVVASAGAFVNAAAANPAASTLQPGTYNLKEHMSGTAAVSAILDPANRAGMVAIPEGSRAMEVVQIASKATGVPVSDYIPYLEDPEPLNLPTWAQNHIEGFLYPATYDFAPGMSAKKQLTAMVDKFKEVAAEISLERRAASIGRSPYDVVIVASLLEAEGKEADFSKIARVIYNRLDCTLETCKQEYIQGRLQMDSTINYAKGTNELHLSGEDLKENGPFNTYQNAGLPPTPIDNPGKSALEAALSPANGDWLYFVSDDNFTEFSDTFQQQQEAEARWRASQGQ